MRRVAWIDKIGLGMNNVIVVGVVIIVFAEPLTHIVAPNLSTEQLHNAVLILRLIAFNPLFFTVSGVLTSTQQVFGRFFFFAITPLVYNLTLIASIFLFKDSLGLVGLGIGALMGGLLQLAIAVHCQVHVSHYTAYCYCSHRQNQS